VFYQFQSNVHFGILRVITQVFNMCIWSSGSPRSRNAITKQLSP
jgi:hypothetical protein